jgi:hypothetical protein
MELTKGKRSLFLLRHMSCYSYSPASVLSAIEERYILGIIIVIGSLQIVWYYTPTMKLISCDIIEILLKTLLTTQNYNQQY